MTVTTTTADRSNRPPTERLERSNAIDYPTKRDEAWRYAPHSELGRLSFGPPAASARSVPADVEEQVPALDGPRIVVVNGVVDDVRSDLSALPDGLRLSTLADALNQQPEQLDAHFDRGADDRRLRESASSLGRRVKVRPDHYCFLAGTSQAKKRLVL